MRKNKIFTFLIFVLIIIIISIFCFFTFVKNSMQPADPNGSNKTITIDKGLSSKSIGQILENEKVIKNKYVFQFILKKDNLGERLKAGNYTFEPTDNLNNVIEKLLSGGIPKSTKKLIIPEGFEVKDIAARIEEEKLGNRESFLSKTSDNSVFYDDFSFFENLKKGQSLEGFLFPATYEIYEGEDEESIIRRMLAKFQLVYEDLIEDSLSSSDKSLNEIITMASIIEREVRVDNEREIVSGIFYKRLDIGMPLQSCATVQYILGERKPVLTNNDTQIDSIYNTYKYKGLPPGPISSPGKLSIEAALKPKESDYLFFVQTGENGEHTFTETYEEHIRAKKESK